LQYQAFASWIQRRRHERDDYRMAATSLKESRRPVPGGRLMEAVMARPLHPEADGGPALRQAVACRAGHEKRLAFCFLQQTPPCPQGDLLGSDWILDDEQQPHTTNAAVPHRPARRRQELRHGQPAAFNLLQQRHALLLSC
jgi:hypothetical protein